jgi:Short C-terminal domain
MDARPACAIMGEKESEPMLRRRRPLLRAAAVGGAGYMAGKKMGEARDGGSQADAGDQQADVPAPVEASPSGISEASIERLKQLASLRDDGVLTDEEFNAEKQKVLDSA